MLDEADILRIAHAVCDEMEVRERADAAYKQALEAYIARTSRRIRNLTDEERREAYWLSLQAYWAVRATSDPGALLRLEQVRTSDWRTAPGYSYQGPPSPKERALARMRELEESGWTNYSSSGGTNETSAPTVPSAAESDTSTGPKDV